jgi:hypothetical protein
MSFIDRISTLSVQEKIRFLHLLSKGIFLHARGLASDSKNSPDLRLLQSDAVVEMLHRIFEQSEHYYKRDDAQRPDADLLEALQSLETSAHLNGIVSSASEYAFQKLPDAQ